MTDLPAPRKRFGQHFLTRPEIPARIADSAGVAAGDRVVEIGPGRGILTDELLRRGAVVTAVELDRDLAAHLRETRPDLRVIEADALRVDWSEVCPREPGDPPWKLVANLPYNVGTAIVLDMLHRSNIFSVLTVMLQREVAERMVASPGDDAFGSLSVHVSAYAEARVTMRVPPGAFHPPPKVDSAVIRLDLREVALVGSAGPEAFEKALRAGFAQRRKTILNSLSSGFPKEQVRRGLEAAGIDPVRRAETLGLEEWQNLAAALSREKDA